MSPLDLSANIRKGKGGGVPPSRGESSRCSGQSAMVAFKAVALGKVAGRGSETLQGQLVMLWCHCICDCALQSRPWSS